MLGNVQHKVSCVFETKVIEEASTKRSHQPYRVVASDVLKAKALDSDVESAIVTEKLDGTCVYIGEFNCKPWLWARHDQKANKAADKKFKKQQTACRKWEVEGKIEGNQPAPYKWNLTTDFKDVPCEWIPASGVPVVDGIPQPDNGGHIPGWVPVDPSGRQHLWHITTVDLENSVGLVLEPNEEGELEVKLCHLSDLSGSTLELIGTNVNGNPYKLGSKQQPFHILVRHGSISFTAKPPLVFHDIKKWFENNPEGGVEGIVWHCANGSLFKIHRHHFGLPWPVDNLKLNQSPVKINVDIVKYGLSCSEQSFILKLGNLNGSCFGSLSAILIDN